MGDALCGILIDAIYRVQIADKLIGSSRQQCLGLRQYAMTRISDIDEGGSNQREKRRDDQQCRKLGAQRPIDETDPSLHLSFHKGTTATRKCSNSRSPC